MPLPDDNIEIIRWGKVLEQMRAEGYAVVVFNPTELENADAQRVEERLIELGWDVIDCFRHESSNDEEDETDDLEEEEEE